MLFENSSKFNFGNNTFFPKNICKMHIEIHSYHYNNQDNFSTRNYISLLGIKLRLFLGNT